MNLTAISMLMRWLIVLSAMVWTGHALATNVQAQILVQASPLAGFQYYDGKSVWVDLHEGDTLALVREPDNAYDSNAVRVEWHGHKLGYVPRRDNAAVARMLDHAMPLDAKITRLLKTRNPWQRLLFEIYAPLQ